MNKSVLYTFMMSGVTLLAAISSGCQAQNAASVTPMPKNSSVLASDSKHNQQQTLTFQARRIKNALAAKDYAAITDDIHPTRGVRFSMYAYVRPESDKVFSRKQYAQYLEQSKIRFTWGQKDGTGDVFIVPLPAYLATWVKANTFNDQSTVSVNDSKASGNSISNLAKVYQNADFVEFYHHGSEHYSGMDWRALRLVFDEYQGRRYLVAIISDQWTT